MATARPAGRGQGAGARETEEIGRHGVADGDAVFFACADEAAAAGLASRAQVRIGEEQGLIDDWSSALPGSSTSAMFEADETTGKIDFSHNPFSMPQGGLKALEEQIR